MLLFACESPKVKKIKTACFQPSIILPFLLTNKKYNFVEQLS